MLRKKMITLIVLLVTLLSIIIVIFASQKNTTLKSNDEIVQDKKDLKDTRIKSMISNMSTEEKVGQLFLARVPIKNQVQDIHKYNLGGYLLFGKDVENETKKSLKNKIKKFQNASTIPMLIASDEEGGSVSRLSHAKGLVDKRFKSPQELYKKGQWENLRKDLKSKKLILDYYGINMSLSPVADVATDKKAFIYDRSFGKGCDKTNEYIAFILDEMKKNKMVATLKHFPGYGNNKDSHTEIIYDNRLLKELESCDLKPFKTGVKLNVDSILVSHNIVTSIDSKRPASISKKVNNYLRNSMKYNGVIMSDDMDMKGISNYVTQNQAALETILAGNDLILSSSYKKQIPYLIKCIKTKKISEERINKSLERILSMKYDMGLIK